MAKSWFRKGKEGLAESKRVDAQNQQRQKNQGNFPFRLKNNTSGKIIFVDDPMFFLYLHTVKVGNRFETVTCIRDVATCPVCAQGENPAYAVFATVIDCTPYTKKDGTVVKFSKKPYIAKGKAREVILRRLEENKTLKGVLVNCTRGSSNTECNVGEDIQVVKKLSAAQLKQCVPSGVDPKEFFAPVDYEKRFAPMSAKDLAEFIGVEPPLGSDMDDDIFADESNSADDDPFVDPSDDVDDSDSDTDSVDDPIADPVNDDDVGIDDLLG